MLGIFWVSIHIRSLYFIHWIERESGSLSIHCRMHELIDELAIG